MQRQATEQLEQAASLPPDVCFRFDPAQEASRSVAPYAAAAIQDRVEKTKQRTVVSLEHGQFQAHETVRWPAGSEGSPAHHSRQLAGIVPSGARYGFDLIAWAGVETYLRGRSLQDIQQELTERQPAISMPLSTLWDQQQKFPDSGPPAGQKWDRTTNQLETGWGSLKRRRRRTHGRGKLTRDFQSLPEEYLLIPNLENDTYVELVLGGTLECLPAKLAEASREAGSFDAWRRRRRPQLAGQLPRRLVRQENFVDDLLAACFCCSPPAA